MRPLSETGGAGGTGAGVPGGDGAFRQHYGVSGLPDVLRPGAGRRSPRRTAEELLVISRHPAHFVCVCDELWRDGVTYETWTETYRRGLAEICRRLAEFDVVCELTAGLPRLWKGAWRFE
ncbi:MAG: hypothetical protein ACLUIX_01070 [Oscillospiraceae bacterium]